MKTESNGSSEIVAERYVDIKTVSKYTSLPVKSLYELASLGKIPSIKMGRRVLFDLHDIDQLMTNLKRPYLEHEKTANKIIADFRDSDI